MLSNLTNAIKVRQQRLLTIAALVLFSAGGVYPVNAQAAEWTIAPYLWASDVSLDLKVNGDPALGADLDFKDLLDKKDTAFMGHFEGRGEKWGGFVDVIYLDLSDTKTIPIGAEGVPVDVGMTLGIYEGAGLYRMGERVPGSAEFDILFGVRQLNIDQVFSLTTPGPNPMPINESLNVSETDAFVGGRVLGLFNEKWGYNVRADIGRGGTDGVFNLFGAISYSFGQSKLFSLDLGYRYMTIKLSGDIDGDPAEADISMSGPVLGFVFNW